MANMHHDVDIDNPETQHEESDVNIRAIFSFAIGLFVVAAVVHVAIYFVFVYFNNREAGANAVRAYPLSIGQENRLPPEPRLQNNPKQDLRDLRAAEDRILTGYRWVDRNAGVVGIPVTEAMKLTLQRGLPSRPAAPDTPGPAAAAAPAAPGSGNRR
jgi:hypothetical protein